MCAYSLKARFVFPIDGAPVPEGELRVEGHVITAVGRPTSKPTFDLGNVAILPALVNAHSHLEFSHLNNPLGYPGMPFTDWIREVLAHRQEREASVPTTGNSQTTSIKRGDGLVFDAAEWRSPDETEEGGNVYEVRELHPRLVALEFGHGELDFSRIRVGDWVWRSREKSCAPMAVRSSWRTPATTAPRSD